MARDAWLIEKQDKKALWQSVLIRQGSNKAVENAEIVSGSRILH